jgi:hypothetical protein
MTSEFVSLTLIEELEISIADDSVALTLMKLEVLIIPGLIALMLREARITIFDFTALMLREARITIFDFTALMLREARITIFEFTALMLREARITIFDFTALMLRELGLILAIPSVNTSRYRSN